MSLQMIHLIQIENDLIQLYNCSLTPDLIKDRFSISLNLSTYFFVADLKIIELLS